MYQRYLIQTITVDSGGAASVTFSSIPQTGYTDLKIVVSARSNRAAITDNISYTFNGTAASAFSDRALNGTGSAATSFTDANLLTDYLTGNTATASTFSNTEVIIPNYTSGNYKSVSIDTVTENNATAANAALYAGLYSNVSAISSIKLQPYVGSFMQYSTFSLYGIRGA